VGVAILGSVSVIDMELAELWQTTNRFLPGSHDFVPASYCWVRLRLWGTIVGFLLCFFGIWLQHAISRRRDTTKGVRLEFGAGLQALAGHWS